MGRTKKINDENSNETNKRKLKNVADGAKKRRGRPQKQSDDSAMEKMDKQEHLSRVDAILDASHVQDSPLPSMPTDNDDADTRYEDLLVAHKKLKALRYTEAEKLLAQQKLITKNQEAKFLELIDSLKQQLSKATQAHDSPDKSSEGDSATTAQSQAGKEELNEVMQLRSDLVDVKEMLDKATRKAKHYANEKQELQKELEACNQALGTAKKEIETLKKQNAELAERAPGPPSKQAQPTLMDQFLIELCNAKVYESAVDGDGNHQFKVLCFNKQTRRAVKFELVIPADPARSLALKPLANIHLFPESLRESVECGRGEAWGLFSKVLSALKQ